jgi:lysophospholipase L1-like esterase
VLANGWLFYGDSITDNGTYPEQVCAVRGCIPLRRSQAIEYRAAISGTTLQWIPAKVSPMAPYAGLASFFRRVTATPFPQTVVVFYGTNDLYGASDPSTGFSLKTWAGAWDEFFADASSLPGHPRIALVGLPYITGCPLGVCRVPPYGAATFPQARAAMDGVTEAKARQYGATFVSLAEMPATMLNPDGLHPNAVGQQFITQQILRALA